LRSWFEVKDDETWGSYRASPSVWQPFTGSSNSASFTIGTDDCRRQSFDEPYCNGILRANVAYEVKLRAYMNTNVAIESDWIQIDGTEVEKSDFGKRSERRFPCHMYLNGCPRKSAAITYQFPTVLCATLVLTLVN
uniref:Eph LBD domain-containing protein n=1 Tax=Angiostrongylus cantonensis TaxID=6313 RepID=A0A0K0D4P8_ANGCA